MQNQGSTTISSQALHEFTAGPTPDLNEDDYDGDGNVENQNDPHDLSGIGGP